MMDPRRFFGEVCVPTLLVDGPFRFHFHSREHDPPYVHVRSADGWAVFFLVPLKLHKFHRYTGRTSVAFVSLLSGITTIS